jgi:hypothetical protein
MSVQLVQFDETYSRTVGGVSMLLGQIFTPNHVVTPIYGAALSGDYLAANQCGFGASEAEAIADLFRLMRPGPITGLEGLFR